MTINNQHQVQPKIYQKNLIKLSSKKIVWLIFWKTWTIITSNCLICRTILCNNLKILILSITRWSRRTLNSRLSSMEQMVPNFWMISEISLDHRIQKMSCEKNQLWTSWVKNLRTKPHTTCKLMSLTKLRYIHKASDTVLLHSLQLLNSH